MKTTAPMPGCTITKLEVRNLTTGEILAQSDEHINVKEGDNISINWEAQENAFSPPTPIKLNSVDILKTGGERK